LAVPFFLEKKRRRKICSFFSKLEYRGNKTASKGKKHFGGTKLKLLLLFHRPATTEKRKTSQLSLKLCAQQGPKSLHRQMDEDAQKKNG